MVRTERESQNEFAGFGGIYLPNPAISNRLKSKKQTPAQSLRVLFTGDKKTYRVMLDQQWRQSASLANCDDPMIVRCVENVIALSTVGV
jgi:hypothetical protein